MYTCTFAELNKKLYDKKDKILSKWHYCYSTRHQNFQLFVDLQFTNKTGSRFHSSENPVIKSSSPHLDTDFIAEYDTTIQARLTELGDSAQDPTEQVWTFLHIFHNGKILRPL